MEVKGDALLIAGSFNTKLAFDSSKESVSTNDLYLAVLNKSSLEKQIDRIEFAICHGFYKIAIIQL